MSIEFKFHKMEGAGNDFVVIDNRIHDFSLEEIIDFTPQICDRRFGIGADGILVLQPSERHDLDYTMIYRNADGSDAGMCGNGARCLVKFAHQNGFNATQTFNVHENVYEAEVHYDQTVSIHFPLKVRPKHLQLDEHALIQANTGTEHLVAFTNEDHLKNEDELVRIGRHLRNHSEMQPLGTNVNFVCTSGKQRIDLQTYERGVEGLTLACGTGAIASAIATHFQKEHKEAHASYAVNVKGGTLEVTFDYDSASGAYHQLILTGPANFVFQGNYLR